MIKTLWQAHPSEHFIFYAFFDSYAHQNLNQIAKEREEAFVKLNQIFKIDLPEKIRWYLFSSKEEGVKLLGGLDPNQAIAPALVIFTVYNEHHKSTPGHELTHILSFYWNQGFTHSYKFLSEGLARYLDQSGRDDYKSTKDQKEQGLLLDFSSIINPNKFKSANPNITYPQSASFVRYLIETYGWDKFKRLWKIKNNLHQEILSIYGKTLEKLKEDWLNLLSEG